MKQVQDILILKSIGTILKLLMKEKYPDGYSNTKTTDGDLKDNEKIHFK